MPLSPFKAPGESQVNLSGLIIYFMGKWVIAEVQAQGTTSIAEKTARPLMSATTVVSAAAVVACKNFLQKSAVSSKW